MTRTHPYAADSRDAVLQYVEHHGLTSGDPVDRQHLADWCSQFVRPGLKTVTIPQRVTIMTTNLRSRRTNNPSRAGKDDVFFKESDGQLRMYDPSRDPKPIYP